MLGFMGLGVTEMCIIVGVGVLLFGAERLPKLMRSLGSSASEFKKGVQGIEDEVKDVRNTLSREVREANRELSSK